MSADLPADLKANPRLSYWVHVAADSAITIRTGKVELGQGIVTAIAAIAADELGVPVDHMSIVAGDTVSAPNEVYTAGSLSIEQGGSAMRWAAASARTLFAHAAARKLGVPVDDIRVEDGRFIAAQSNMGLGYGDLAAEVDLDIDVATLPRPGFIGAGEHVGLDRLDLPAKLSGAAFIHDLDLPGLCHGRVLRPPHPHARLVTFDPSPVEAMAGVLAVVVDGSFVGVVARREEEADAALRSAERGARWRRVAELPPGDDENAWMETATAVSVTDLVNDDWPDPATALRLERAYSRPYIAHASLAPSCALAHWQDGRLTVHSHSQGVYPLRSELAAALDVPADAVDVIHAMSAGCYGHNGADDVALDAALLARAAGVPVLCRWSRLDELTWSPFGAAMRMRLSAGLDTNGRITEWTHDVFSPPHLARPAGSAGGVNLLASWHLAEPKTPPVPINLPGAGTGDRNAVPLYNVGRRRVTHHLLPQGPLRSSALRALGAHGNVFAIESFMDELAALAGKDPLTFRLTHLGDERARAVVQAAAAAAAWNPAEAGGEGAGRGLAFARYKNSGAYCAVVARVEVTDTVRLVSIHAAVDCGAIIHRDGVLNQIEGGIVQAASWTLKEAVRWDADGILTRDWASYPIIGFAECPPITIEMMDRPDALPLGAGECAAGPVSGAIGNALAHALGAGVRHMPITVERIKTAIEELSD